MQRFEVSGAVRPPAPIGVVRRQRANDLHQSISFSKLACGRTGMDNIVLQIVLHISAQH